jgi:flagellar export protein FliJ
MEPLAVLARLAGLEVERERRALAALDAQIEALRQQIAQLHAAAERERRGTGDLARARLLGAYLEASWRRLRAAATEQARLEQARTQQVARLIKQRLELKRLELLQARHEQRRRAEASRREQRELDEHALLGAARRPPT